MSLLQRKPRYWPAHPPAHLHSPVSPLPPRRCSSNKRSALADFSSNVQPILEYCSVIRLVQKKTHIIPVERA